MLLWSLVFGPWSFRCQAAPPTQVIFSLSDSKGNAVTNPITVTAFPKLTSSGGTVVVGYPITINPPGTNALAQGLYNATIKGWPQGFAFWVDGTTNIYQVTNITVSGVWQFASTNLGATFWTTNAVAAGVGINVQTNTGYVIVSVQTNFVKAVIVTNSVWPFGLSNAPLIFNGTGSGVSLQSQTATASGADSFAFGPGSQATANSSVAIGPLAQSFGPYSVALGQDNVANGYDDFVCGAMAKANNDDCFVWSDGQIGIFYTDHGVNTFNVSATGGIFLDGGGTLEINSGALTVDGSGNLNASGNITTVGGISSGGSLGASGSITGYSGQFTTTLAVGQTINVYQNIALKDDGVPSIVGSLHTIGNSGQVGPTSLYTPVLTNGLFRMSGTISVTTAGTGTNAFQLIYKGPGVAGGTTATLLFQNVAGVFITNSVPLAALGQYSLVPFTFRSTNSAIQIQTANNIGGGAKYDVDIELEALNSK